MKKHSMKIVAALLAAAITLSACGQADPSGGGASASGAGGSPSNNASAVEDLIVIVPAMPVSLDPHVSNDLNSAQITRQMRETLLVRNWDTDEIMPGLAVAWDMPDAYTLNMELRQGVYFHNGEPFTARDVQFTIERALSSSGVRAIVETIEEVVINDDHNITILLNRPFVAILAQLTHSATQIVNETAILAAGDYYHESPVGTGPFVFDNIVLGDRVEMVRNENYWGTPPAVSRATFRVIPEASNRLIEVETGNAHIAININPHDIPRVEESPNIQLHRRMNFTTSFIGFNVQVEPFNDPRVRHAISYAINTEALVDSVFMGTGRQVNGFLPNTIWAYVDDLEPYEFNIDRANELMAEAGLEDGFSTTIWFNSDSQQRGDIANIVQSQLRQINIDVTPESMEWATYLGRLAQGEHDMFILQWTHTTGEPDNGIFNVFHSTNHGGPGNRQFYTNPIIDDLIEQSRAELNISRRRELLEEIQRIIRDDAPQVFLQQSEELLVSVPNIRGFEVSPASLHLVHTVYFE